jgi:hypothetical protein
MAFILCSDNSFTSALLDQAIKIFERQPFYAGEKGRCLLLKSRVLEEQGSVQSSQACLQQAQEMYKIVTKSQASEMLLSSTAFDRYVHVWGR